MATREARALRRAGPMEIRLVGREAQVLLAGAACVGGLLFGLGYMVGKRSPEPAPAAAPPGPQSAQIEQADAAQLQFFSALEKEPPHEELRPLAPLTPRTPPTAPAAEPAVAAEAPAPAPAPAPADAVASSEKAPLAEHEAPDTMLAATEPGAAGDPTELSLPAPPSRGNFTLQVGSYRNLDEANRRSEEMQREHQVSSFLRPAEIEGRGTWYRVRVGQFPTKEEAEAYGKRLARLGIESWVVQVAE